ncbi:PREDICTED: leucine-rich repeat and calponin homology domain-containing protein 3-like, partial [Rhinopithecus bieti]|uniref:leucine-rich repeat and calponin homology domain-containing protein 3-like n=1 Tax=Rhinopithecus bieti TaxID=61621 RepID=UPI00083BC24D
MAAAGLVAVAAAAEYSGTVASGGNLPGVHCGPSSGAGPGSGPGSWSRSLDRALEEAAVTGVLSLSGRKLREFPRGAANHDLTDTTRAGPFGFGVPNGAAQTGTLARALQRSEQQGCVVREG